jgi:hypothetical protein
MKTDEDDIRDSPMAWFYTLEDARLRHDFDLAAKAKRELERLGIRIDYVKPITKKDAERCAV